MKYQRNWKKFISVCFILIFSFEISACSAREKFFVDGLTEMATALAKDFSSTGTESKSVRQQDTENPTIPSLSKDRYVYSTLGEEAQQVYDEIFYCISNQEEKIIVSTLDKEVLDLAYDAVNADYGGLFWTHGYVYTTYSIGKKITGLEFAPNYTMTYEKRLELQEQVDQVVTDILAGISQSTSDYEKAKYVFDYLTTEVEYNADSADNQNILSVFLYKSTVCQGYAEATQYLLQLLGIQSIVVTGTANGESHAWNMLRLDGDYYYMDTTWGNSSYSYESGEEGRFVNYDYLNVTTEEIEKTHRIKENFELPICTATEDNYFRKEGLYVSDWSEEKIGGLIKEAWDSRQAIISIKFANDELYDQALTFFVQQQKIAKYCEGMLSFRYLSDSSQRVLTLRFFTT